MTKPKTKDEWIKQRMSYIGASEVASAIGVHPTRGRLHLYNSKVQGYTMEDNIALKHGRLMEEPISQMYADLSGRKVENHGATLFQRHPDIPFLGATLDRVTYGSDEYPSPADGPGAAEIKNIDIPGHTEDTWTVDNEDVFPFVIQNQVQAWCTGYKWCSLIGKFPYYGCTWFDHLRDDEFLRSILPRLEEFWNMVQSRTPPPPDDLPGTLQVIKRVWPKDKGTTVVLDDDWTKTIDD